MTHHQLVPQGPERMELDIGAKDWPVADPDRYAGDSRWYFDPHEGAQEIIDRRIGGDEIAAIRVSLAYVDAQNDYFERKKQQSGIGEYAHRLVERAEASMTVSIGRRRMTSRTVRWNPWWTRQRTRAIPARCCTGRWPPYQGYVFRILQAQGAEAPGGAKNYVRNGAMTDGFALIAWPASYGSSGDHELHRQPGRHCLPEGSWPAETARIARHITQFDSDQSWARVNLTDQ